MRKNSSQPLRRLRNNRWEFHLRTFATSLMEDGYTGRTVQFKLGFLACLEHWLQSAKLSITDRNERLVDSFLKRKPRERRGNLRTLQQFLDHLRRQNVVPARNLLVTDHHWSTF